MRSPSLRWNYFPRELPYGPPVLLSHGPAPRRTLRARVSAPSVVLVLFRGATGFGSTGVR